MAVVLAAKSDALARRKTKGSRSGRPLSCDADDIKNWRGPPTRDDTYALVYRGSTVLAPIVPWLS